ncbi:WD40-repeat-containing domain protein [Zopfochytrium polystomum]|nr:WD40-repeat-containing domain protein [Zopfochytrium polystomum]
MFLSRWPMPRICAADSDAPPIAHHHLEADSQAGSGSTSPAARVPWKKLYEHRLAVRNSWIRGQPVEKRFRPVATILALHPQWVIVNTQGGTGEVLIYRRSDLELVRTIRAHTTWVWRANVDVDGKGLLTMASDNVKLWDMSTDACELALEGLDVNFLLDMSLHPAYIVAVARQNVPVFGLITVMVWDRTTGSLVQTFHCSGEKILAFAIWGLQIVTLSSNGSVKLWNVLTGDCDQILMGGDEAAKPLSRSGIVRFDGDRVAVLSRHENCILVWDSRNGALLKKLEYGQARPNYFHLVAEFLANVYDSSIELCDIKSGNVVRRILTQKDSSIFMDGSAIFSVPRDTDEATAFDFVSGIPFASYF